MMKEPTIDEEKSWRKV